MRAVMVRYRVKPERVQENRALVEQVYAQLNAARPEGLRYATFLLPDGVSFVHLAAVTGQDNPLQHVPAFQAFTAGIAARCDEPPVSSPVDIVGNFGLIAP